MYEYLNTGDVYKGQYVADERHGYGVYTYKSSKNTYEGLWENDRKQGKGTLTTKSGESRTGIWVDNTL